ncbi:SsgA family sporulation/cell division regulator [Streptomyces sp. NBC_00237]|uniref:SsgA family sporulation/cell division regulator n=1 Tax=Streptomyces sp. NBC_00237 TaxID=2975687 RepID=UPI002253ACA0|nr:SsgA family sporulation/cell division regulator [Streptomyces sp. NBC_00237]MCX5206231.1 SsgA family sporulation/cell division regulator [Streptomyces sp. NBC_00237]
MTIAAFDQPTRARLITSEQPEQPEQLEQYETAVPVVLHYDANDPLAVRATFAAEASLDGTPVSWTFARELLNAGLRAPSGSGDVHIWPCGRAQVVVELHSPDGLALVQFDTAVLRRFLLRSYAIVPAGHEDLGPGLERGLSALFGGV